MVCSSSNSFLDDRAIAGHQTSGDDVVFHIDMQRTFFVDDEL
jgi:hypothetical protein